MIDDRPVEIPSRAENFDLDSFLDSLSPHLRMKIVREISEPEEPTHRAGEGDDQRGVSGPRAWHEAWVVGQVALALVAAYTALLVAWLVSKMVEFVCNYVKEKNER